MARSSGPFPQWLRRAVADPYKGGYPMVQQLKERPKPFLFPEYCKGCGRCIDSCPKHCITLGSEINPATGLIPVILDLEACNGCGLCITACPEPYGLMPL